MRVRVGVRGRVEIRVGIRIEVRRRERNHIKRESE
jgi:hypothetical protein